MSFEIFMNEVFHEVSCIKTLTILLILFLLVTFNKHTLIEWLNGKMYQVTIFQGLNLLIFRFSGEKIDGEK